MNNTQLMGIIIRMRKKIVLTGGGTAGHVIPLLALLPLLEGNYEIHYIGRKEGAEKELTENSGVVYHGIDCPRLTRGRLLENLAVPFRLMRARKEARAVLSHISPSLIVSKGGYVALPASLECGKVPLLLHESDTSLGLANKLAAKRAAAICSSFPLPPYGGRKIVHTGSPLRGGIYRGNAERGRRMCGFYDNKKTLLVMGGSLGAKAINDWADAHIGELTSRYNVIHIRGRGNDAPRRNGYAPFSYISDPADLFALTDLAVTRGGGNTLFELGALRKPMIIVPLPKGASRGDQVKNAEFFEKHSLALSLDQNELNSLSGELDLLEKKAPSLIAAMGDFAFDGTAKISEICVALAESPHGS